MAAYPPGVPPTPPPVYDYRTQRRIARDQARAQRAAFRAQRDQMRYEMRSHRRSSIVGPLLLIAVGVIFLLIETGKLDYHAFWGWYGRWWPALLVIAGVVVLAEWALDQYYLRDPQQTPYRRSLGGGVVTLLLLVGIVGFVASQAHLHIDGTQWFYGWHFNPDNLDEFFGDKHESDQTMDVAFPAGSSLAIVNPRGDVTISGTSDDDRVHIAIHKQVWERSDSAADSRAQQLTPSTTTDGSAITLTMPALDGARADLVITVPAAAATTVNANRGDIHVASIKAPVYATANHGDIELSAITGPAAAHINSGSSSISAHSISGGINIQGHAEDITLTDITGPVSISGDFFGSTHLEHIAGPIHFHTSRTDFQLARLDGEVEISPDSDLSADQAVGPVVLTTRDRNITLDRIAGDVSVTNRNGTIDLTAAPPLGNITLADRNGTIKTTLPEHANFSVQAETSDGSIDNDFQLSTSASQSGASKDEDRENHKSLTGTVGSGGPMIRITTSNGDISLHKAEVAPIPPTPPSPPRITLTPPTTPAPPALPKLKKP
jgi:DUF4097 and DUF4098 domain-containing protein YvlB